MSTIEQLSSKSSQSTFDKKVLAAIQHLHPYVKHRLIVAESKGILPKNMYTSNGIIDEGIATLYRNGYDVDLDAMAVKLRLFYIVDEDLNNLLKKEAFHQKTISTDRILKEELGKLNEDFTMDADLDLILNTELDDISYHQNDGEHIFLYQDSDSTILREFEIEDLSGKNPHHLLGKFYHWLPLNVSNIVDLYIYGNLRFEDIARIKDIQIERIERIFEEVKKQFRSHID
ncbi:MAG: hypothetical protein HKN54_12125 [Flavobacteriaceae bacterium]|nr:hypothetical protein [Flavobacteriaceae bacterium]